MHLNFFENLSDLAVFTSFLGNSTIYRHLFEFI